ncbi:MAG: hypothetical protein PHV97_01885 [Candidatus Omnitrophica bacterium]|jgi:hypothetical protein|nr:hypothetical protein [Candidatus Omnitrophota bacterium]
MRKELGLAFAIIITIFFLSPAGKILAFEDTLVIESMQTIDGDITAIDTDNKRVTARWMEDEVLMKYQDVVLDVPDTCVITKNGETIELDDLEANDPATIRFDSNAQPLPRASSITVTE